MQRTRILSVTFFAMLAGAALWVSRMDAEPETVREIVPGVWFREGDLKNLGYCNNILIEMKDYLIVVDANFPNGARAAMQDAKRISSKPVKYVFDTHAHGDHAYGNVLWTRAGATTLAYKGVAEQMRRDEPKRWRAAAATRKDVAELGNAGPEPPAKTFDENLFVLNDGKRRVEFRFFGWAHTPGDGFVYLPKEQVLCTGDAAVNGPYNYMNDGNIANWPEVVRAAAKLKVKHVLPGHGVAGGREVLTGQEQFLMELYKAVKAGVDQGRSPEEIRAAMQFSEAAQKWAGGDLLDQVKETARQIAAAR